MKKSFFLLSAFILLFASCSDVNEQISFTAMNTYMAVRSYGKGSSAKAANARIKEEIEKLENIISVTKEESDLYKINNSNLQTFTLQPDTAFLLEETKKIYEKTDGALNPALYPVIKEWGFTTENYKIPSEERIRELLSLTDFSKIEISKENLLLIKKTSGMQLDFGAVGKGYAGDLAVKILKESGIKSALLDFGGNIQVLGTKPDGKDWTVGIKNPWGGEPLAAVKLSDSCMITSGGYERFFIGEDGKRYIHIFDGKTGSPVENNLESVTIICKSGLYGDALSTSLFVMGLDKAVDFWRSSGRDFDFVIITKDKEIFYSKNLEDSLTLLFDFAARYPLE